MKKLNLTIVLMLAFSALAFGNLTTERDTVIIRIGKTQIIIQTESPDDLRELSEYDLNQMIMELTETIDTSKTSIEYVRIDKSGDQFLPSDQAQKEMNSVKMNPYDNDNMKVIVKGGDISKTNDYTWKDYNERRNPGTINAFDFELGTNNLLQDGKFPNATNEDYTVRPWGSWYVSIGNTLSTSITGPLFIEWGGNISWYNFKFENDAMRMIKGDDMVEFFEDTRDVDFVKSKLTASYINFSFVPMLDFSYGKKKVTNEDGSTYKVTAKKRDGFKIGIGAYAGYRLGSKTKYVYREDNNKRKDKDHSDFFLNNFRYGVRGRIGFRDVDLFVNYDLNDLFADNRGPQVNGLSFGIIF